MGSKILKSTNRGEIQAGEDTWKTSVETIFKARELQITNKMDRHRNKSYKD